MTATRDDEVRTTVRKEYGKIAQQGGGCGCSPSCCGPTSGASENVGYAREDLKAAPEGADMGSGAGTLRP